ncbi:MAG: TRAP transporter small permease subunit [Gammaproteobacteria bacterium]|nr:TRAP transporter small permease subunit [Gammaproteobacteria bacterium]
MRVLIKTVHRIEDVLLIVLLSSMIALASTQILLRIFFDYGLIWAEPLLRVMVLWLGLTGATVASRHNKHIHIDILTRFFSKNLYLFVQTFVGLFTAWICFLIAWHGARWVRMDYVDEMTGLGGIPSWMLEIIIPISFAVIGIRYFIFSMRWGSLCYRRMKLHASRAK